jgi:hypothetical protein
MLCDKDCNCNKHMHDLCNIVQIVQSSFDLECIDLLTPRLNKSINRLVEFTRSTLPIHCKEGCKKLKES